MANISKFDFLDKINNYAERLHVDASILFSLLYKNTKKIDMYQEISGTNYLIDQAIKFFNPVYKQVSITDYENGMRDDLGNSIMESMLSVGRNQVIYDNLDTLNLPDLKKSIEADRLVFVQKEGRYYLESDGTHRMLQAQFLYLVQSLKCKTPTELTQLKQDFTFYVPTKHIETNKHLLGTLGKISNNLTPSRFIDYFTSIVKQPESIYNVISFDNDSKIYTINYKGYQHEFTDAYQAHLALEKLYTMERDYSTYKIKDKYYLEYGNVLKTGLTFEQWKQETEKIKTGEVQINNATDYFIIEKPNKEFDLQIPLKKTQSTMLESLKNYSAAVQFKQQKPVTEIQRHLHDEFIVLSPDDVNRVYTKNTDAADIDLNPQKNSGVVTIYARRFQGLTEDELNIRLQQYTRECTSPQQELSHMQESELVKTFNRN